MAAKTSIKNAKERVGTPVFISGVITVGVIAILGAVFIGKSDTGQINVTAAIENSNQANVAAGGDASQNVETVPETFKNMTNGGLVPQETQAETPVAETAPVETGTTTVEGEGATPEDVTEETLQEAVTE